MQESTLMEIIEQAFDRLSCPFRNNGVYNELQSAILKAYKLGKQEAAATDTQVIELQQLGLSA